MRSLRYAFGGDHPSQTTHQAMSSLQELELKQTKGRISTAAPQILAYLAHCLRPILHIACPNPMLSYSKGSRGLFVPSRVIGIFTDTTISLGSRLRQCPDHYTIRAGRNLPDKEFRYLRTVIVTPLLLTFQHRAGVRLYTASFEFAQPCVFGKQLPGPILCALPSLGRDPFSRSYRVNLPSSLTVINPSALVYSTRLRVSVCGTGALWLEFSGFSRRNAYLRSRIAPEGAPYFQVRIFPWICLRESTPTPLNRLFRQTAAVSRPRHRVTP